MFLVKNYFMLKNQMKMLILNVHRDRNSFSMPTKSISVKSLFFYNFRIP